MGMIQGFVQPSITKRPQTSKVRKSAPVCVEVSGNGSHDEETIDLYELSVTAKNTGNDIVELLSKYISIEEVKTQ